jgi:decaprenyl-phosphate phosphoribosyltransferase
MILSCIKEARPSQWTKNVLVFAAPAALGVLNEWSSLGKTLTVFAAFCMVASGTYYWNDIMDVEQDRQHPKKRNRPIASGAVPLSVARVIGSVLLISGPALGYVVRPAAGGIIALYAGLTIGWADAMSNAILPCDQITPPYASHHRSNSGHP